MTPDTYVTRLLRVIAHTLQNVNDLSDAEHLLPTVRTAGEDGRGEVRLTWTGPGIDTPRFFRITVEEVE